MICGRSAARADALSHNPGGAGSGAVSAAGGGGGSLCAVVCDAKSAMLERRSGALELCGARFAR
jgi:hypothetical protein